MLGAKSQLSTLSDQPDLSRRERRKLEVQSRIAEAAMSLMEEKGCEHTTVEDICEQADIARKTFYNHYSGKLELIQQLCDELLFTPNEALLQHLYGEDQSLRDTLNSYMSSIEAELGNYAAIERMLIREAMMSANSDSRADEHLKNSCAGFKRLVARAQARGEVSEKLSADFYAEIIVSAVNGIMVHWTSFPDYPLRQRVDELTRYLLFSVCEYKEAE
jgi:AcrR family transcriptional regulator